jgi:hypothetical protein
MPPVTDLRDTRVLIPRVRRGLEGAQVATPAMEDDAVNAVIADAVANVILFTGGLWGHQLQVATRDSTYLAPTAWLIDPALSEEEGGLIVIQAQLDFLYNDLKATKVSQTIKDEATEWSYTLSASALSELLKGLREQRDKLIEAIAAATGCLEAWVNLLYERDTYTDSLVEPFAVVGGNGGQEGFTDPRFL